MKMKKSKAPLSMVSSIKASRAVRASRMSGRPAQVASNAPESISALAQSKPVLTKPDQNNLTGYAAVPKDKVKAAGASVVIKGKTKKPKTPSPAKQELGAPKGKAEKKPGRNAHGKALFSNGASGGPKLSVKKVSKK